MASFTKKPNGTWLVQVRHKAIIDAVVLQDSCCITVQDRFENGEYRWQTLGYSCGVILLLVAHIYTDSNGAEIIRIISARRATKAERKQYERG